MTVASALTKGRESFERRAWDDAHAQLTAENRERALEPEDLVMLASAAQMIGADVEAESVWARAHTEFVKRGDNRRAAWCAYWIVLPMLFRGDMAQAGGWIARTSRLLESVTPDCAEHGYLLCAIALRSIRKGDVEAAHASFETALRTGERLGDADLIAQARHGEGRSLIRLGEIARGASLLDEVMAAVTADGVSQLIVGGIYCSVLEACQEMYDVRRAQEWTEAMEEWCARQPETLPYRGQCLVHRAELMQLHGAWSSASEEAERARERFMHPPPHRAIGLAYYRIAELQRLRGEHGKAEESYRQASAVGLDPQPGLAMLRLAQGQPAAARRAIARALEEAREPRRRARILPAFVDISIAASEIAEARAAAEELSALAANRGALQLRAEAAFAMGEVLLAEENAKDAIAPLRGAFTSWRELEAPYEMSRARVLLARAFRAIGDSDAAEMELECARQSFTELGAAHDLSLLDALAPRAKVEAAAGELTSRELEVLRLVATGKTNRAIAAKLGISEKTVARHVSNIFTKLELSSRAAATAYAYEHGLLSTST